MDHDERGLRKKVIGINQLKEDYHSTSKAKSLNFISRFMCFAALPHTETKEKVYERITKFGSTLVKLHVYSPHGIPYGIWARRILSFICTEVIKKKTKNIELGNTQAQFFKKVSLSEILMTGGKNGALKSLQEQAKRIFSSSLYIECLEKKSWSFENSVFAEKGIIFWENTESKEWTGHITLSDNMFEDISRNAVPLESTAIVKLNSFEFDIYIWLRWKSFFSKQKIHMSWDSLFEQFGFGYKKNPQGKSNFKRNFLVSLRISCSILNIKFSSNKKTITIGFAP